jgi:hypothetical protein
LEGAQLTSTNPFEEVAEVLREYRQRVVREAGLIDNAKLLTPSLGEILGGLAGMINDAERLRTQLAALAKTDPELAAAFTRASGPDPGDI